MKPVLKLQPLYSQLPRLILQTIKDGPTLDGLYIWIMLVRIALSQQITPFLLHRLTPSEQITPSLLHHFTPSEQITPSLLQYFTPLGNPTPKSFYNLWTNYPLTLTPFYPPLAAQLLHH